MLHPHGRRASARVLLRSRIPCRALWVAVRVRAGIAKKISPMLSICRRAVRRGYIEDESAAAIAALTPFILVP
jgi:hypothetical protein